MFILLVGISSGIRSSVLFFCSVMLGALLYDQIIVTYCWKGRPSDHEMKIVSFDKIRSDAENITAKDTCWVSSDLF